MAWPGRGAIHAGLSTPSTKGRGRITISCRQMWFKSALRKYRGGGLQPAQGRLKAAAAPDLSMRFFAAAFAMLFALTATAHAQSALADRIQSGDRRAALAMLAGRVDV